MKNSVKIVVDPNIGNLVLDAMDRKADIVKKSVKRIREEKIQRNIKKMIEMIVALYGTPRRIFVVGEGRSEEAAKGFAMRLMHLGFDARVMGESTTPGVQRGDIVVAVSGSGTTDTVIATCQIVIGEDVGAKLIAITSKKESTIARMADLIIDLPGRKGVEPTKNYRARAIKRRHPPELLGSTFERNATVFCDSIIEQLFVITKATEQEMKKRHATTSSGSNET